jgi:D-sedoheptulose 7-phosphate isomerase
MKKGTDAMIRGAIETHKAMVAALEDDGARQIKAAAEMIIECMEEGGTVYICGNGGSAADSQHIAAELVGRFARERKGLAAVALTTDTSALTSISNDYGFENVFARQVEGLVRKGDVLWAISTSGSSANVIAAVKAATKQGAKVLGFTGRHKSKLEKISDACFCAANDSTARSQEIHILAYHIICDIVEERFAAKAK